MARTEETPWQRSLRRGERRFKNSRSTSLVNGWMLILASPLLLFVGVGGAVQEDEPVLGILGSLVGFAVFLLSGIFMVRASRRMQRPTWLEILRFRESGDANTGQPQSPPRADQPTREE